MVAEKLGSKGQAWFCTTGLSSDVVVEVEEMIFHLHKFPLMSKSGKLHRLITEQEENPGERRRISRVQNRRDDAAESREEEEEEEEEEEVQEEEVEEGQREAEEEMEEEKEDEEPETRPICLPDFPGGPETFEGVAKFCYGVKVELTSWNVAPLRCAAEYLQMTEEFAEDNLVSRTEQFLAQSVLRNLQESVLALKSCEDLVPLAENVGIVQQCIDSIAVRASSSSGPGSLFGWPVNDGSGGATNAVLWNGIDTGIRRRGGILSSSSSDADAAKDSWFEALTILSLPMYKRVIAAMKARGLGSEAMEAALVSYAKRSIPGLSRSTTTRRHASAPVASETEQRELLETVISNLPPEKSSRSGRTTTRILFGLLRAVNILRASEASRTALERKIASQLEEATLDDLLIPSYSYLAETLYDVDCVQRILAHFLQGLEEAEGEEESSLAVIAAADEEEDGDARILPRAGKLMAVGKLVDGYLAEIASDINLVPDGFRELALALPDRARVYNDGLYRAVDIYLKAHPRMREEERERVCGVVDCRKLTLEACIHAAQNERLPLRAVVQVLFFEQVQLRQAIAGTLLEAEQEASAVASAGRTRGGGRGSGGGDAAASLSWRTAERENQVLRLDMDSMRIRVQELERECASMKKAIAKMDGPRRRGGGRPGVGGARRRRTRMSRLGCRFSTQVCDSHERTVVESKSSRLEELSP